MSGTESSTYLMGWLRDYLWFNSSQLINGYSPLGLAASRANRWIAILRVRDETGQVRDETGQVRDETGQKRLQPRESSVEVGPVKCLRGTMCT